MTETSPHIFWITIDSLRYDHTSLSGYHRDTTPHLDNISSKSKGYSFSNAIAHSTRTAASVPSILTGLPPESHGNIGKSITDKLSNEVNTVPQILADCGYTTLCISENGFAGEALGIDERFDRFTNSRPLSFNELFSLDKLRTLIKYPLNMSSHGPGWTLNKSSHDENWSFFTLDITQRKLNTFSRSNKLFCYIHFNDTHHPYVPPVQYRKLWKEGFDMSIQSAVELCRRMSENMWNWMANGINLSDEQWAAVNAMYDSCIRYVDDCVCQLTHYIRSNYDDFVIVITSDHGELLGEYGLLDHHSVLHDALINVPLITYGLTIPDQYNPNPVQHNDIMYTLLKSINSGIADFRGHDITETVRRVAFAQSLKGSVDNEDTADYDRLKQYNNSLPTEMLPHSLATAARSKSFKLINTDAGDMLFLLQNERDDIKEQYPKVKKYLARSLAKWKSDIPQRDSHSQLATELSDEMRSHLSEMGYLN